MYRERSVIICTPTRDGWHWADVVYARGLLGLPMGTTAHGSATRHGMNVGEAFDSMAQQILRQRPETGYMFTLEDDMLPPPDTILSLVEAIEGSPYDALGALYFTKTRPSLPLLFGHPDHPGDFTSRALPEEDGIVEVNAVPTGATLFRMELLRDLAALGGPIFQDRKDMEHTFDFGLRARAIGARLAIDTRIQVGHMNLKTKEIFP